MIPQSAGATPFGIFLLADDYLLAARATSEIPRIYSHGPTRLLCYHAAELFLKAYLRSNGLSVEKLRSMQHDITAMIEEAKALGLILRQRATKTAVIIKDRNDYVRARYMVVHDNDALPIARVIAFVGDIRFAVRIALDFDELGNPKGRLWIAAEPEDYLTAGRRPV